MALPHLGGLDDAKGVEPRRQLFVVSGNAGLNRSAQQVNHLVEYGRVVAREGGVYGLRCGLVRKLESVCPDLFIRNAVGSKVLFS